MRFLALAFDYDGTIAKDGLVADATVEALGRARDAGHRLILVTGRVLPQLLEIFPQLDLFDRVVAENGALLYDPKIKKETLLAGAPREDLVHLLEERGVHVDLGRVIIATWEPHGTAAFKAIHELGLEYDIFFNKGAVMLLPSGVSKGSGLEAALRDLELSPHNVVSVGDAENDHSLLQTGEAAVAVANALPSLKDEADWVTAGDHGTGVIEVIDELIRTDLAPLGEKLKRHDISLGTDEDGSEIKLPAYGSNVLIAGTSGGGKSSLVTALLEGLAEHCYQFCVVDPEGDYETVQFAIQIGTTNIRPDTREAFKTLRSPVQNVILNLLAIPMDDRPGFFEQIFADLEAMRTATARPHFIVVDEAHHMLPTHWEPARETLPKQMNNMVFVTTRPDIVSPTVLRSVTIVLAVGRHVDRTIADFSRASGREAPALPELSLDHGQAALWEPARPDRLVRFDVRPTKTERRRHIRKYAFGEMGPESFYFRGPEGKLHLKANNLQTFINLANGVDDETWLYHLKRHEYSKWIREMVKDPELAREVAAIEEQPNLNAQASRRDVAAAIEKRYTAPAGEPL